MTRRVNSLDSQEKRLGRRKRRRAGERGAHLRLEGMARRREGRRGARTGQTGQVLRLTRRGTEQGHPPTRPQPPNPNPQSLSNSSHNPNPIPSTRPPIFSSSRLPGSGVQHPGFRVLLQYLLIKKENLNRVSSSSTISRNLAICGDATPHVFGRRFRRCRDGERPGARHCSFLGFCPFPSRPAINAAADGISFS